MSAIPTSVLLSLMAGIGQASLPTVPRTSAILVATSSSAEYHLTTPEKGVRFDLDGDGAREQISWVENVYEVALLAIDRNENGRIDNGTELVGGQLLREAGNGFIALDKLAPWRERAPRHQAPRQHAGDLEPADALWGQLLLWHDLNRNGVSEPAELRPVGEVLGEIGLGYSRWTKPDGRGNLLAWRGWAQLRRPRPNEPYREIYDVVLQQQP